MCKYFVLSCSIVGPPSTPTINTVTPLTTSINLVWSQRAGDVVDSYTLSYSYVTRGCEGTVLGGKTITGIYGSIRTYNLSWLEENSDFNISITAVNGAGSSPVPARTSSTTLEAGGIFIVYYDYYCIPMVTHITYTHCLPPAPSGTVSYLKTTVTTSTNISIAWGRVPCKYRNVKITRYGVIYGPISDSNDRSGSLIIDINTNNVFTITGLLPRTRYTIQVRADHVMATRTLIGTELATMDVETTEPEGKV